MEYQWNSESLVAGPNIFAERFSEMGNMTDEEIYSIIRSSYSVFFSSAIDSENLLSLRRNSRFLMILTQVLMEVELTLDERLLVNPYEPCDVLEYKGIKLKDSRIYVNILYKRHNKPIPYRGLWRETDTVLKHVGELPITPKTKKKPPKLVPRTKPAQEQEYSPKVEECRKEFEEEDVPVLSEKVETLLKDWYKCGSYEIPLKGQGKNGNFAVARDRNVAIDVAKFIAGEVLVPNLNNPSVLQVLRDAQYISA